MKRLLTAKIVYRKLLEPINLVDVPENQPYSIRGYFLPAESSGYQFITYIPLKQYWEIDNITKTLTPIHPPLMLSPSQFTKIYANKIKVFEENDLSISPSVSAPCINILVQNKSMYDLEME